MLLVRIAGCLLSHCLALIMYYWHVFKYRRCLLRRYLAMHLSHLLQYKYFITLAIYYLFLKCCKSINLFLSIKKTWQNMRNNVNIVYAHTLTHSCKITCKLFEILDFIYCTNRWKDLRSTIPDHTSAIITFPMT